MMPPSNYDALAGIPKLSQSMNPSYKVESKFAPTLYKRRRVGEIQKIGQFLVQPVYIFR